MDLIDGGVVKRTLRLDYDSNAITGGWSPGLLNWDDGLRARDAGVDTSGPDGIEVSGLAPAAAARAAGEWFRLHSEDVSGDRE